MILRGVVKSKSLGTPLGGADDVFLGREERARQPERENEGAHGLEDRWQGPIIQAMKSAPALVLAFASGLLAQGLALQPVARGQVSFDTGFWAEKLATNRKVTIPHCFQLCDETKRIQNFAVAGGLAKGQHEGYFFNDSDLYKVVEAACLALAATRDEALAKRVDEVVAKIAAAQEKDGYLYTARTLLRPDHMPPGGKERWSDLGSGHELYCAGHLYEAAVAHFEATGKRTLLDVAQKHADLVASVFGPGKNEHPDGHPEVELALVKLAKATGKDEYSKLAKFFVEARGRKGGGRALYGEYAQDHLPLREQTEPVGHAVRAAYLYSGAADLAAVTGDEPLALAIDKLWQGMLAGKVYLTGGIGSRAGGEAFGATFELPNERAYAETCAAIANVMLGWRMFLRSGDGDAYDVLERSLYNGVLAGVSLHGDRFFYPNPLASRRGAERSRWFDCACCPSNVVRIVEAVPGMAYATKGNTVFVCLYQSGTATLTIDGHSVEVQQATEYPWQGRVTLTVLPDAAVRCTLALRIPGWARDRAWPNQLYRFADECDQEPTITINGEPVKFATTRGFAVLDREWRPKDKVVLTLPMPARTIVSRPEVVSNLGKVAVQRGPLVYCAEACDQPDGRVQHLVLNAATPLTAEWRKDLLSGVTVLRGKALATKRQLDESIAGDGDRDLLLVPYHTWANRKRGSMAVWLALVPGAADPLPAPTLATTAKVTTSGGADPAAMVDQLVPKSSIDHDVPFFHWWPKKGSKEQVILEFVKPARVQNVAVYWFQDEGIGECRLPVSWKLFGRVLGGWQELCADQTLGCAKDSFQEAAFPPHDLEAIKLEVQLPTGFSTGIHEVRVR